MTEKDDKSQLSENSSNNASGHLGEEDVRLWKKMMEDVKPLEGKDIDDVPAPVKTPEKKPKLPKQPHVRKEAVPVLKNDAGTDLDKRTEERLCRGQMPIEARIDLHGMTQEKAHSALRDFIVWCYAEKKRCILVITGKGGKKSAADEDWLTPKAGVLKQNVPRWLEEQSLKGMVLKAVEAQRQHGGSGALYVLLRRHRP